MAGSPGINLLRPANCAGASYASDGVGAFVLDGAKSSGLFSQVLPPAVPTAGVSELFFVGPQPDDNYVVTTTSWFPTNDAPFLTRLDNTPGDPANLLRVRLRTFDVFGNVVNLLANVVRFEVMVVARSG